MHVSEPGPDEAHGRVTGDGGTAILEFTFVGILLLTLVFGIINFGLILSFKQDMTRAAAEGARAGAVAVAAAGQTPEEAAVIAADDAVGEAVREFGGSFSEPGCSRDGMSCVPASVDECTEDPTVDCVIVTLSFDYDDAPLYGELPLISAFLPNVVNATSVARINE